MVTTSAKKGNSVELYQRKSTLKLAKAMMAGVLTGKSWREFLAKNYHLPAAFDRQHAAHEISTPMCISLKSVVGLLNPQPQNRTEYQLSVCLYDVGFRLFFGRQWFGPVMVGHGNDSIKLHYNQNAYFHTSLCNTSIILVVEVIAHTIAPDGNPRKVGCGWSIIRPFTGDGNLPDASRGMAPPTLKVEMYHGTPRALLFMDEPIEANQLLKPIASCHLIYSVGSHKAMLTIIHLLPENVIVGNNTVVPGIEDKPNEDRFQKPQLRQQVSFGLDGLVVHLQPNLERFEEELCELLSEDRANRENRSQGSTRIAVVERRLHVGVHNGWTFTDKPQTFHLEPLAGSSIDSITGDDSQRRPTASPSFRRAIQYHIRRNSQPLTESGRNTGSSALVLKSQIHLTEVIEDPMFAVVFQLEYVISESLSDVDRKVSHSLARAHTRTISVRWTAWNPFLHSSTPEISVALTGGTKRAPDDSFVYKLPDTEMQDLTAAKIAGGILAFRWTRGAKGEYLTVPQISFSHGSMLSIHSSEANEDIILDASRMSLSSGHKPPSGKPRTPRESVAQQQMMQQQQQMLAAAGMMYPQTGVQGIMYPPAGMPLAYPFAGFGPPPISMQMAYAPQAFREGPVSEMRDLPFTQVHQPVVTFPPPVQSKGLSRAAYAQLYSAGFPLILDRNGEPPEILDPNIPPSVNLAKEKVDPLQANEIIFQFLAFSKDLSGRSLQTGPGTVFFSFQFYRYPQVTTERLLLSQPASQLVSNTSNMPFILQKLDRDGSLLKGPPGLEVKYYLDPLFMKPGEVSMFLSHLTRQVLHIDVWDGDSLLLIGSCSVDMKYLCRGGNEAVQATFELDVVVSDQTEDSTGLTGDLQRGGSVRPVSTQHKTCGKLHLRIANIGHPVDNRKAADMQPIPSKSQVIVSQTAANSAFKGGKSGTLPPPAGTKKARVARAQPLSDIGEVASLLLSNQKRKEAQEDTEPVRESDAERHRRLARMKALKAELNQEPETTTTILSYKKEKTERIRDFKTLEIYRHQTKHEGILTMLSQNITTEHAIFPSFATAEFFEFVLRNPYNQDQCLTIQWEDKDLKVVTDAREWRYFKQFCGLATPLEEGMFSTQSASDTPQLFLRPKETVHIPFKYQSFQADHSVMPQGPSDPFDKSKTTERSFLHSEGALQSKTIKVKFLTEDGRPMAVLKLQVEPQPHIIDQTFRFHHPENSFLKKSIRLPPFHALPGAPVGGSAIRQIYTRCSDPNVILDCKPMQPGDPHDIFLKVALGPSPQIKRFFITIYIDPFLSLPIQVWQCYVHALQRVDINCIEGQTSQVALLLKGTQATRLVRCYSSHPSEMTLSPQEPFVLAAGTVHEMGVAVRPLTTGSKFYFLNVVDIEYHQLVRSWLVCTSCRAPIVSRAFTLTLPVGGGKGCSKRITYTNPYPLRKTFKILTDRPDLLQFKENLLELEGGAAQPIGLRFAPVTHPGIAELLVFINDEEDKNEETFRITAEYKLMVE